MIYPFQQVAVPHVALEHGALPWQVLTVLLVGMFGVLALAVLKLGNLKSYLNEPPFPTHAATVVAGIVAFLGFGLIAMCRMALGMEMPEGYGDFLILLGAVIGVTGAWGVGKRATDEKYVNAKAAGAAAGASSNPAPQTINAEGNVNVTQERRIVTGERVTDLPNVPQAGVKPVDAAVRVALETAAGNDPRLPSPDDDERADA